MSEDMTSETGKPITFDSLDGDAMLAVQMDVADDIAPGDSHRLEYTDEARLFHAMVKQQFADYRRKHPDAVLDVKE